MLELAGNFGTVSQVGQPDGHHVPFWWKLHSTVASREGQCLVDKPVKVVVMSSRVPLPARTGSELRCVESSIFRAVLRSERADTSRRWEGFPSP